MHPARVADRARLRARTFGEVLDDSIHIYREHWRVLLTLSALVMVPVGFVTFLLGVFMRLELDLSSTLTAADLGRTATRALAGWLLTIVATVFLSGAVARFASDLCLGRIPSLSEVARFARSHLGRLLGVSLLFGLLLALGFILLIVPAVLFLASFQFATPAVVVEGAGVSQALRRSWELSTGFRWKILGIVIVVGLINSVAGAILAFPLAIVGVVLGAVTGQVVVSEFLSSVASTIAQVITAPLSTIAVTLLYFDLRVRKEAFDLTVMAQELSAPPS